ncbi:MAG: hypothetical protein ACOH5I_10915 [Oligoflexus sp.]
MIKPKMKPALLSGAIALGLMVGCGSSDSNDNTVAPETFLVGGNCNSTPGSNGSWEITDLDEAGEWTQVCADAGTLSLSDKYLRIENLQLAEGESLTLMPFSRGEDNGFSLRFSHNKVEAVFTPLVNSEAASSIEVDLTQAKTFCIEIHDLTEESHIMAYVKGTESAVCVGDDQTEPMANWDAEGAAQENLAGNLLGFTASANVQFDKIVVTNRISGTEGGNPAE